MTKKRRRKAEKLNALVCAAIVAGWNAAMAEVQREALERGRDVLREMDQ